MTKKHALPSPRVISNALVRNSEVIEKELTLAVMQWGQFVGHDLAHTAVNKMSKLIIQTRSLRIFYRQKISAVNSK